eukprot:1465958-Amphidinium_carterae.1
MVARSDALSQVLTSMSHKSGQTIGEWWHRHDAWHPKTSIKRTVASTQSNSFELWCSIDPRALIYASRSNARNTFSSSLGFDVEKPGNGLPRWPHGLQGRLS